jgi:hypothetical protein
MSGTEWIRLKLTRPFENSTVPKGKATTTVEVVQVPVLYCSATALRDPRQDTAGGITAFESTRPIAHFRAPFQVRTPTREHADVIVPDAWLYF